MSDNKIYVRARAVKRPDYPGYFIPQHLVPNDGVVFEVVETEEDPQPRHPARIGQAGYRALVEAQEADHVILDPAVAADFDPRPADMSVEEKIAQLQQGMDELRKENRDLRDELHLQHKDDAPKGRGK